MISCTKNPVWTVMRPRVHEGPDPGADRAAGGQRVGVAAAVRAGRVGRAQQPVDGRAGVGQLGQGEQGAGRRSVRRRRRRRSGRRTGSRRRPVTSGMPSKTRPAARACASPCAARPLPPNGFGVRQVPDASITAEASSSLPSDRRSRNGAVVPTGGADLVEALTGDRGHRGAEAQVRGDRRVGGERGQVVG